MVDGVICVDVDTQPTVIEVHVLQGLLRARCSEGKRGGRGRDALEGGSPPPPPTPGRLPMPSHGLWRQVPTCNGICNRQELPLNRFGNLLKPPV